MNSAILPDSYGDTDSEHEARTAQDQRGDNTKVDGVDSNVWKHTRALNPNRPPEASSSTSNVPHQARSRTQRPKRPRIEGIRIGKRQRYRDSAKVQTLVVAYWCGRSTFRASGLSLCCRHRNASLVPLCRCCSHDIDGWRVHFGLEVLKRRVA